MKFRKGWLKCAEWAGTLLLASAVVGCSGAPRPMTTMADKSDLARWIDSLFMEITVLDAIVLAVVVIALFLAVFFYSSRVGDPGEPATFESAMGLELAWTIGPALILILIAVPTVRTIMRTQPSHWPSSALPVKVVAHQWWWEFDYPTLGIKTADEVHLPTGREIHFELVSADVIHSFWVPALGGKRDVIPGQQNEITLVANTPGDYYGQCTEFCGTSHANMRLRAFVQTPENFKKWVAQQQAPPVHPTSGLAAAGAKEFANAPCAICHEIRGVSGFSKEYKAGFRGPDLTHFGSRTTIAGAIMANTPANLAKWLRDPAAVKPGAEMPDLGLRGKKLNDMVAYLESLK